MLHFLGWLALAQFIILVVLDRAALVLIEVFSSSLGDYLRIVR